MLSTNQELQWAPLSQMFVLKEGSSSSSLIFFFNHSDTLLNFSESKSQGQLPSTFGMEVLLLCDHQDALH